MKNIKWKKIVSSYGTLMVLAGLIIIFGILKPKAFLSVRNFINVSRQMAPLTIIAIGTTLVMAVNEYDLSVGSLASLGGVTCALLAVAGYPIPVCFLLAVLFCMVFGIVNGCIIARFHVLSFITTLGMSTVLDGVIYRLTGGSTVFQDIPEDFSWLGTTKIGSIPVLTMVMVFLVIVFAVFMRKVPTGRRLYAVGGNEEASRIAGVKVARYKILAFTLCAMLAGFTGCVVASRVGSANTTAGAAYFLQSYAAVFIGCTVSRKGVPNVLGTVTGVAILTFLANGLTMLQMPTFMQDIITGVIIIVAVIVQKLGHSNR